MNEKIEQMIERMVEKTKVFPQSKWYPVFKICLIPIVVLYYTIDYLFFLVGFLGLLLGFVVLVNFRDVIPSQFFETIMYSILSVVVLGEATRFFVGSEKGIICYVVGIFRKDEIPQNAHVTKVIEYKIPYSRVDGNTESEVLEKNQIN